jgi:hypothetical protein
VIAKVQPILAERDAASSKFQGFFAKKPGA